MERNILLSLFVVVVTLGVCTYAVTETIKSNPAQVVVQETVVTPSASPSATISPTVAVQQGVRTNRTTVSPTTLPVKATGAVK